MVGRVRWRLTEAHPAHALIPIYANLRREKPKGQEFQPLVTKKKGKVTGKKEELKNSQEYPTAFAEEVVSLTELRLCGTKQ